MGNLRIAAILFAALFATTAMAQVSAHSLTKAKMPGTWLLNGSVKAIRIILKGDGTFDYSGQGATSKGRWQLNGSSLRFNWTHVDGQKVKPNSMTANFPVSPNNTFQIGKFVYAKPGTSLLAKKK